MFVRPDAPNASPGRARGRLNNSYESRLSSPRRRRSSSGGGLGSLSPRRQRGSVSSVSSSGSAGGSRSVPASPFSPRRRRSRGITSPGPPAPQASSSSRDALFASPTSSPSAGRRGKQNKNHLLGGVFDGLKSSARHSPKGVGMGGMACSPVAAARTSLPRQAPPPAAGSLPSGSAAQQHIVQSTPPPSPSRVLSPPPTPGSSTSSGALRERRSSKGKKDPTVIYSDRYIPSRSGTNFEMGYTILGDRSLRDSAEENKHGSANGAARNNNNSNSSSNDNNSQQEGSKEGAQTYSMLLRTELLGMNPAGQRARRAGVASTAGQGAGSPGARSGGDAALGREGARGAGHASPAGNTAARVTARDPATSMFRYQSQLRSFERDIGKATLSPVGSDSAKILASPRKAKRKIPKVPFKVLDAPALQDDFYLNLVDWSSQNILAVGLGSCVYLWSACTSKVTKLCDLGSDDPITSVSWTQRGSHVSVGTTNGDVQVWDATKCKKIRSMEGHQARVGTMAWNSTLLASGSRDRKIFVRDIRDSSPYVMEFQGHRQEVCGLRWSFDDQQLASGGNDNKLLVWNLHSSSPAIRFNEHSAAVKAIAWSPHQHGLLASGGGTADRCIRFWNTLTGSSLNCIDTGSQVCNLMWSKNINEIVSTHGYSLNQIIVWRYPSMTKVTTLTGHTYRVLYLAMSPDGQTIVTGAGDETLRFWNVFPGLKNKDGSRLGTSLLFPSYPEIR